MIAKRMADSGIDLHKLQQTVKWIVYTLLIINFGFYLVEDWTRSLHVLTADSSLQKWLEEFATSIDEIGWFLLLAMFELETYVLEDEEFKGWVKGLVQGIRILCYVLIAHTVFAYANELIDLAPTQPVDDVSGLCELTDEDVSFVRNLHYTKITPESCDSLSDDVSFFRVADEPVVTDAAGLELERDLALADLLEAIAWLVAVLAIELGVRLQERGVTGGKMMSSLNWTKLSMYLFILGVGVYWASLSHWLYLWDEIVWIGGFAILEFNLSEWRDEIRDESGQQIQEAKT